MDAKIGNNFPECVSTLLREVGLGLLQFLDKGQETEPVIKTLALWRSMSKPLSGVARLASSTQEHPITSCVRDACDRLEKQIAFLSRAFIKTCVENSGIKEAYSSLCKSLDLTTTSPASVAKLSLTLSAAASADDKALSVETISPEIQPLQTNLPFFVKFKSLDVDLMREVAGEKWDQMEKFCNDFQASLASWIGAKRSTLAEYQRALAPYR